MASIKVDKMALDNIELEPQKRFNIFQRLVRGNFMKWMWPAMAG